MGDSAGGGIVFVGVEEDGDVVDFIVILFMSSSSFSSSELLDIVHSFSVFPVVPILASAWLIPFFLPNLYPIVVIEGTSSVSVQSY